MKIAIISDTHFGDSACALINRNNNGSFTPGKKYNELIKHTGTENDYLVMVGDIFDLSISSYDVAYNAAQFFFNQIKKDNVAKEIIYIPGNHDADMWHIVEHQVNIIMQVEKGRPPRPFKLALPGIIDERKGSKTKGFHLPGVTVRKRSGSKYSGLFLDKITQPNDTLFNFVYPNLYIVTDDECVLVTHGHLLEEFWSFGSEWAMILASRELNIGNALDIREMVGMNFPLCQLACTGIGQAGPLTEVVRKVQMDVKSHELVLVRKLLDRLSDELDKRISFNKWNFPAEWGSDALLSFIEKKALKYLEGLESARYSDEFASKKEVQERFRQYYAACLVELDVLRGQSSGYDIPPPLKVIFGHTHEPISWNATRPPKAGPFPGTNGKPVSLFNTGGWLEIVNNQGTKVFCGAEIFTYQTNKGFNSFRV